jgi:hypothetical protein
VPRRRERRQPSPGRPEAPSGRGSRTSRRNARRRSGRRGACFRNATVLRRGIGRVVKAGDRRRQFDDRLEIEPVPDVFRHGAGRQGREKFFGACHRRLRQDSRDGGIVRRHHRGSKAGRENAVVVAVPGAKRLTRCRAGRSPRMPGSGGPDRTRKLATPSPAGSDVAVAAVAAAVVLTSVIRSNFCDSRPPSSLLISR